MPAAPPGRNIFRRLLAGTAVATLAAIGITLADVTPSTAAPAATIPADSRLRDGSLLVGGFFAPRTDWTKNGQMAEFDASERSFGRRYDLAQSYYPFQTAFPSWREGWHISQGRTPVIGWNGITDAQSVANGAYDTMIRERARGVAALGAPVVMRFAWEMDGAANPVRPSSATAYVAQWRRIHRLFAEEGAHNVIWMWCPNAWAFDSGAQVPYYPGNDVVDWIGADGYDFAPVKPRAQHRSFESIFAKSYDWARAKGKPFSIGEFGALEDPALPGYKAAWFDAAKATLSGRFAGTKAILAWSHSDVTYDDKSQNYDFRFDTSPGMTAAWARWSTATNTVPVVHPTTTTAAPTTSTTVRATTTTVQATTSTTTVADEVGTRVVRPRAERIRTVRPQRAAIRRMG